MYQNTDILNGMINAAIIQIFATMVAYITIIYLLEVKRSRILCTTVIFKLFIFNLVVTYLRYQNINENDFNTFMFVANTVV